MSPEYFTTTLSFFEAELFCRGLRRRERGAWERARYISFYSAMPHLKNFKFDNMHKFPWEEERGDESPSKSKEEELRELKELWDRLKEKERTQRR